MKAELMRNVFLGGGRAARALHPQRRRPRHGARRRRRPCATATSWCSSRRARAPSARRSIAFKPGHHADRPARAGADPDRLHRERSRPTCARAGRCCGAAGAGAYSGCASASASRRRRPPRAAAPPRTLLRRGTARSDAQPHADVVAHPRRPHPELQHRRRWSTRRCARRAPQWSRCGSSSTAAPTAPPSGLRAWPRTTRACASTCCRATRGKGAAVLHGLEAARGGRLHARADDGLRRPASGRPDPGLHGGVGSATRARWCSAGRCSTPVAPLLRVRGRQRLERVDATSRRWAPASAIRCTAFASIRSRRWSRSCAASLDAPLRLRYRGGRAPGLARRQADQHRRAGAVPPAPKRAASRTSATGATTCC